MVASSWRRECWRWMPRCARETKDLPAVLAVTDSKLQGALRKWCNRSADGSGRSDAVDAGPAECRAAEHQTRIQGAGGGANSPLKNVDFEQPRFESRK